MKFSSRTNNAGDEKSNLIDQTCTHVEHVGFCTNSFEKPVWIWFDALRVKRVSCCVLLVETVWDVFCGCLWEACYILKVLNLKTILVQARPQRYLLR